VNQIIEVVIGHRSILARNKFTQHLSTDGQVRPVARDSDGRSGRWGDGGA
jgi:hypothetical protein